MELDSDGEKKTLLGTLREVGFGGLQEKLAVVCNCHTEDATNLGELKCGSIILSTGVMDFVTAELIKWFCMAAAYKKENRAREFLHHKEQLNLLKARARSVAVERGFRKR